MVLEANKFIEILTDYLNKRGIDVKEEEVFIVWYCKTLQNQKAILSTKRKGALLYEMTYNGDKRELYVDSYQKVKNEVLKF